MNEQTSDLQNAIEQMKISHNLSSIEMLNLLEIYTKQQETKFITNPRGDSNGKQYARN